MVEYSNTRHKTREEDKTQETIGLLSQLVIRTDLRFETHRIHMKPPFSTSALSLKVIRED